VRPKNATSSELGTTVFEVMSRRAVAWGLDHEQAWYTGLAPTLQAKRDRLAAGMSGVGLAPLPCQATYFMNADFRELAPEVDDVEFCRQLTIEAGVTLVPLSALYAGAGPRHLVRFCFSKRDAVLDEALARLRAPRAGAASPPHPRSDG
jgi:aspartate/methionine/tyrosine aminotransferase